MMVIRLLKNYWLILAIVLSLIAGRNLLTNQHFPVHDDIQVFRLNEFINCLKDFQIPCRWSSNLGKGYGYPLFNFYPPAIYIISAIFTFLGFSLTTSLNLLSFITFPLSALGMYKLINNLTHKKIVSFFASVAYVYLPYRALNVFVRGVYAETLALTLFPFLLNQIFLTIQNKKYSTLTTILIALILITHNISALFMIPLSIVWSIILLIRSKNFRIWRILLINYSLGIALSTFFILPALIESKLVQTSSMTSGYFDYIAHFISLKQLFITSKWGYGGSAFGVENDEMSFLIGYVHWIVFALLLLYGFLKKGFRSLNILSALTMLITLTFLFLTHPRSIYIWEIAPFMKYVQFPWRFIGIASIFLIISISLLFSNLRSIFKSSILVTISMLVIISNISYFTPKNYTNYTDDDFITGTQKKKQNESYLFDYLPVVVKKVPESSKSSPIHNAPDTVTIKTYTQDSRSLSLSLDSQKAEEISISIFDYPGWKVSLNGNEVKHYPDSETGLITLGIPAGDSHLIAKFNETNLRKTSNIISLISLFAIIITSKKQKIISSFA